MLQATAEFRKNGFNDEDAAQLGQIASMYQNVSDEIISAGDSASFIISQLVAFGDSLSGFSTEAEKATHIINAVNEVANNFSVSSADLANNLGNMSAVMAQTGASFEESLAMLTAITEVTRNATKASRGLVSIGSRLSQVVDKSSSTGKALKEIYEGLNIALFDNEGQLRSSYEIFSDLAAIWDTLDKNTQNYIASQQAGTNQFQNFAALMQNFSTAAEATSTALNSAGSAARENNAYMEGLEAKTNLLKATFQDLANNVIDSQLVKSLLDLANSFLSLLNTPVGTFITQVTLLTGVMWGFVEVVKAMQIIGVAATQFKTLLGILPGINTAMTATAASTTAAAGGVTLLGTALNFALPILGLISVALVAIPKIVDAVTVSLEEQQQKVSDLAGSLQNLQTEYDALVSKENLTPAEERRLALLKAQIEANKILLEQNAQKQYQMQFGEDSRSKYTPSVSSSEYWTTPGTELGATGAEKIQNDIKNYNELQESIKAVEEEILSLDKNTYNYAEQVEKLTEKKKGLEEKSSTLASGINELAGKLIDLTGDMKDIPPEAEELLNLFEDWAKSISNENEELENNKNTIDESSNSIKDFASELKGLSGVYDVLSSAVEEYNTNGYLTSETLSSLLSLDEEYINLLSVENGKLVLNNDALYNKANQLKQNAIQERIAALSAELYTIATQGAATAAENADTAISNASTKVSNWDMVVRNAALGTIGLTEAVNSLDVAMGADPTWVGLTQQQKAAMEEAIASAKNYISLVNQTSIFTPNYSSGSSSGSKGRSAAVDPIKEQSDAFKELNEIIEHNIFLREKQGANEQELIGLYRDYQNQLNKEANWFREQGVDDNSDYIRELQKQWWSLEEEINSVYKEIAKDAEEAAQEAKKAWEEAMDAQIKSLEKKQNAYETLFSLVSDMAQDEIDTLEEQRKTVEEYWQGKIDALEQANKELEEQIEKEEALDALARSRQTKVMVYKDGRFQYLQDIDKVSEAQANLEKIEREETLKKELENLEKLRDEELASIDKQIKGWEEYKEAWSSVVNNYQEEQDRLLVEQELGIKLEGENWQNRLNNLASYVKQYKDLMAQLSGLQFDLENGNVQGDQGNITPGIGSLAGTGYNAWAWVPGSGYVPVTVKGGKTQQTDLPVGTIIYGDDKAWVITGGKGGDSGYTSKEYGPTPENIWTPGKQPSGFSGGGSNSNKGGSYAGSSTSGGSSYNIGSKVGKDFINNAKPGDTLTGGDGSSWTKNPDGSTTINRGNNTWIVPANANGTLSAIGGLSLVGEKGPELRVLNEGDGVIPSEVTKNLWAWGATSPASMMNNIVGGLQSMGQQIGITIQNFNPNLPNVQDGQDFANYMQTNFWREAIQFAKA